MGLTPKRRRRSAKQPGGVDYISALPDDLLLLILAGLGCTAAAARTSGLSRRWRGLWARLGDISLRDVAFESLAAVLSLVARPPASAISLLEIRVPRQKRRVPREHWPVREDVASLARVAARLAPETVVLALPPKGSNPNPADFHLPCFRRAVSIVLESLPFVLRVPPAAAGGEGDFFPALHTLRLLDCIVVDKELGALLSRCPRLRVLELRHKVTTWPGVRARRIVRSAKLQELVLHSERPWLSSVHIVAPMLKQLTMSFWAHKEATISVSASTMQKVSWRCSYAQNAIGFGLWSLHKLKLETAETPGQLPSLQIYAGNSSHTFSNQKANLANEVEKHTVVEFSDMELHLSTAGHVFGALVLHLLQMKRIRSVLRRLKVVRQSSPEKEACHANCPCEPTDWRTQIIALTALEEVGIYGFQGEDHEYDLLKLVLGSAPMLRRMTVKLSHELSSAKDDPRTKIQDLVAYSSVECLVYLG
ncbi:uncharacterized protein [Lolium perenne]|uniref:uncharacterized protein n=1 Tax=Lolium perenne TaxID=4522 RepID=UPI0021F5F9BF|nr:uncharacterized protein LOC127315084 [Lolium perenne]